MQKYPPKQKKPVKQSTLVVMGGVALFAVLLAMGFLFTQASLSQAETLRDETLEALQTTKQDVGQQQTLYQQSQETYRGSKLFVDRIDAYAVYNARLNRTVGANAQRLLTTLSNKQAMTIRNFDPVYNQTRRIGSTVFTGATYTFEITGNYRAVGTFTSDMENLIPLHITESLDLQPTTDSAEQLQATFKVFIVDGIQN